MPVPAGPGDTNGFGLNSGPCSAWLPADCAPWPDNLLPVRDMALMAATEILWGLTKRRFGTCELTLHPCREECWPGNFAAWMYGSWLPTYGGSSWGYPFPALMGGRWYNLGGCGTCGDSCSCTELHQVRLPYPVAEIIEVKIDGAVIVTGDYRVDGWEWLVLLNGLTVPACNDLNNPDGEGSWSVTLTVGEAVPVLGQFAANDLALQIARGCIGDATCNLPTSTLKSLNRLGSTQEFLQGSWLAGYTSLPSVNEFISLYNPTRSGVASIYAIDGPPRARIVGT